MTTNIEIPFNVGASDDNPWAAHVLKRAGSTVGMSVLDQFAARVEVAWRTLETTDPMTYRSRCGKKVLDRLARRPTGDIIIYEMLKDGYDITRYQRVLRYLGALWETHPDLYRDDDVARVVAASVYSADTVAGGIDALARLCAFALRLDGVEVRDHKTEIRDRWLSVDVYNLSTAHSMIVGKTKKQRVPWKELICPLVTENDRDTLVDAVHPWTSIAVVPFFGMMRYLGMPNKAIISVNVERFSEFAQCPAPSEAFPSGFQKTAFRDEVNTGMLMIRALGQMGVLRWWAPHKRGVHSTLYRVRLP